MNHNPQPESDAAGEPLAAAHDTIRIDNGALVLPSGCTMPPKCIKTNGPVSDRDMILANLSWAPTSLSVWGLFGVAPLLFAYFVGCQRCTITYGLAPRLYYKSVFIVIAKILVSIALLAATIFVAASTSRHWIVTPALIVLFVLFLASVPFIFFGNNPLRVADYRDGMYWVEGFSPEYLNDLGL